MVSLINDDGMRLEEDAERKIKSFMQEIHRKKDKRFANGRTVRNEFQMIKQIQSKRISQLKKDNAAFDPFLITASDVPYQENKEGASTADVIRKLDNLIGLTSVKEEIRSLITYLEFEKMRFLSGGKNTQLNLHFIFKGRPGTGKTTVARLLGDLFRQIGILTSGQLIEVDRKDLVGQYIGHTAQKTTESIDKAYGGILFIDEAYTLMPPGNSNDFGKEAIDTLLKRMEDDKGKFIVIAAGYAGDMDRFIQANEGLSSRFTKQIFFEDYTGIELMQIFRFMMAEKGMNIKAEIEQDVLNLFEELYQHRDSTFANGRTVRNIFERSLQKQATRLQNLRNKGHDIQGSLNIIELEDIASSF